MSNEIVIGCNLEALTFAYLNNLKVYYTELDPPLWWIDSPVHLDLERHYLPHTDRMSDLWYYLFFILRLAGNIPYSDQKFISISENSIQFDNNYISFDKAYIFSDEGLQNLHSPIDPRDDLQLVCDYYRVRYTKKPHKNKWYNTENKLANKIYLFNELNKNKVLAMAVSELTRNELEEYKYSLDESCAFIKWWFKENNIRGCLNNVLNGKKNYYIMKFFPTLRVIEPLQKPLYEDTDTWQFMTEWHLSEILSQDCEASYVKQIAYHNRHYGHQRFFK